MDTYRDIHTLPIFLLFWNLAALWYERGPIKNLHSLLPSETRNRLINLLRERARPGLWNEEKRAILALAGLIYFLNPQEEAKLQKVLRGRVKGLNYLHDEAMQQTFVPAFFTLIGMSLLRKAEINFTPSSCKQVLEMAANYEDQGLSIDMLCSEVRRFDMLYSEVRRFETPI